jgi:hypothetical protein
MVYEETLIDNQRIKITADAMLLEDIRECKRRESRVVQEMEKQLKKLWENDGVIYRNGKIYIPNSQEIRDHILHKHRYSPDVGHPGIHQMLELVKRTFWWPTIKMDIKRYVKGCKQCQKNKSIRKPEHIPLNPLPILENPWQEISIDMISPLLKSENNDMMRSRGEQKKTKEDFKPSDSVWLEATNIHSNQPSRKLDNKKYGPFEVEEKVSDRAYCLKLPETWAIHNVFHLTLLTRTHTVEFDSQKKSTPPPPDIIEEEEKYEIKEICRHRMKGRGTQYLVHRKGYGSEDNTWLPQSSLGNAEELLSDYLK